jgi:hypothetical protein
MRIREPGTRSIDRIMLSFVAGELGIPATDAEMTRTAAHDCCSCPAADCDCGCKCPDHKAAKQASTTPCPECESPLLKTAEMERCAVCGYAQEVKVEKKVAETKKEAAGDKSVLDYFKQIYPDDYAKELCGDNPPKTPKAGPKVEYGTVKGASIRVSAREVLA